MEGLWAVIHLGIKGSSSCSVLGELLGAAPCQPLTRGGCHTRHFVVCLNNRPSSQVVLGYCILLTAAHKKGSS